MPDKLLKKRNLILIIYAVALLALWTVSLIFGNAQDKVTVLVLSLVVPFVVYGFIRLMYKIVRVNASSRVMRFFYCFFLIVGLLVTVMMLIEFIGGFPNGLSPMLGASGAIVIATLDSAKRQY